MKWVTKAELVPFFSFLNFYWRIPGGAVVKSLLGNAGDTGDKGSIPGLGRSLRGGRGKPLQYFCLEDCMDKGAWWAIVKGIAKSRTRLSL